MLWIAERIFDTGSWDFYVWCLTVILKPLEAVTWQAETVSKHLRELDVFGIFELRDDNLMPDMF